LGRGSISIKTLKIDLTPEILKLQKKTGEAMAKDVAKNSPQGATGEYAKGWDYSLNIKDRSVTIGNLRQHASGKKSGSLTHLLELGHRTKNGGWVAPQEHIRPAFNRTKRVYLSELKKIKIQAE
jgi:hypothetical protein